MHTYVLLLRGINVGGHSKVPMADLRRCLIEAGFSQVMTYIASGNVLLRSALPPAAVQLAAESAIDKHFDLQHAASVLALPQSRLQTIVDNKPDGFGEAPESYHSDVVFLIGTTAAEALPVFSPRPGVDTIWPGEGVIYSQRLSAERTKSRLNRIVATPLYRSMTIRSWNTVIKLLRLLQDYDTTG